MNRHHVFTTYLVVFTIFISIAIVIPTRSVCADDRTQTFNVGYVVGDGQSGRVFRKLKQAIQDRPVETVKITLRRHSGDNNTYVNLRYGDNQTFENGKRVHLRSTGTRTETWSINGERPNGRQLVLNVYKGEAYVESLTVHYKSSGTPLPEQGRDDDNNRYNNNRYNDNNRYDDNNRYNNTRVDENEAKRRCRRATIRHPRIDVGRVKQSGGLFSGKHRIHGSLIGNCVLEAGYFEHGRLKKEFNFPLDDQFQRVEFELRVKSGKNGEIRIMTTDGKEDTISIDRLLSDEY